VEEENVVDEDDWSFPSAYRERVAAKASAEEAERRAQLNARLPVDCVVCMDNPRDAVIVHGGDAHHVCCGACAGALKRASKPCPVCQRPIEAVLRYFS
jgi:hypothetical protein